MVAAGAIDLQTPAANPPPHQKPNKTRNPPTTPHNTTQRNPGMAFNAIPGFSLPSGAQLCPSCSRFRATKSSTALPRSGGQDADSPDERARLVQNVDGPGPVLPWSRRITQPAQPCGGCAGPFTPAGASQSWNDEPPRVKSVGA